MRLDHIDITISTFHERAKARAAVGDQLGLIQVGREYETYRETSVEPWAGADNDMAAIIEGFMAHKGDLQ